ncbi:MAG: hypothetical protein ACXADU_15030 [Promethearchaeota archaeon]
MKTSMKSSLVLILIGIILIVLGIIFLWIVITEWASFQLLSEGILLLIAIILIIVGVIVIIKFVT